MRHQEVVACRSCYPASSTIAAVNLAIDAESSGLFVYPKQEVNFRLRGSFLPVGSGQHLLRHPTWGDAHTTRPAQLPKLIYET
jgi:hypothetical protein